MRGQAGDALAALQQRIDRAERILDDLLNAQEAAPDALFRELEDGRFGVVENFFGRIGLIGCARNRSVGGVNQPAQQRLVADNLDVMLDAGPVGNAIQQRRNIRHVADGLQFFVPVQLFDQRDDVDRPRRLGQIDHARINAAMRIEREIFRPQMLRGLVVGKIVEQDRAENGALGLHARGQCADAVVGRRQFCSFEPWLPIYDQISAEANCNIPVSPLWTRSASLGKVRHDAKSLVAHLHATFLRTTCSSACYCSEENTKINFRRLLWA